jgi:hypothetical protein
MSASTRQVLISLDRIPHSASDDGPLSGRVQIGAEPDRPFTSWVGLLAALETAMASLREGQAHALPREEDP